MIMFDTLSHFLKNLFQLRAPCLISLLIDFASAMQIIKRKDGVHDFIGRFEFVLLLFLRALPTAEVEPDAGADQYQSQCARADEYHLQYVIWWGGCLWQAIDREVQYIAGFEITGREFLVVVVLYCNDTGARQLIASHSDSFWHKQNHGRCINPKRLLDFQLTTIWQGEEGDDRVWITVGRHSHAFPYGRELCAVWIRFVACILGTVWKFDEGNGHAIVGDDHGLIACIRERIDFNELH